MTDAQSSKLSAAYDRMIERLHETAQREGSLRERLQVIRDAMVELGELSREEAVQVAEYVERDIQEAAHFLVETGEDLRKWWRFDVALMEERLWEWFSQVADQTSLQLQALAEQAHAESPYASGEISGPGTLICVQCGHELLMKETGTIPPCPQCQGTAFRRFQRPAD